MEVLALVQATAHRTDSFDAAIRKDLAWLQRRSEKLDKMTDPMLPGGTAEWEKLITGNPKFIREVAKEVVIEAEQSTADDSGKLPVETEAQEILRPWCYRISRNMHAHSTLR